MESSRRETVNFTTHAPVTAGPDRRSRDQKPRGFGLYGRREQQASIRCRSPLRAAVDMRTGAVKSLGTDGSLEVGICNIEFRSIVPRTAACPFGTVASFGMKEIDAPDQRRPRGCEKNGWRCTVHAKTYALHNNNSPRSPNTRLFLLPASSSLFPPAPGPSAVVLHNPQALQYSAINGKYMSTAATSSLEHHQNN